MGKKLYVGNLPFSATDQSLGDIFAQCGTVESTKIITDRDNGRSKGFGGGNRGRGGYATSSWGNRY